MSDDPTGLGSASTIPLVTGEDERLAPMSAAMTVWKLLTWMGPERTPWAHACAFDLERAWRTCPDVPMLFTLAIAAGVDFRLVLLAACDCAEAVVASVEMEDPRPRDAIAAARSFALGAGSLQRCEYMEILTREGSEELRRAQDYGPRLKAFDVARSAADAARRLKERPRSQDAIAIASACVDPSTPEALALVHARISEQVFRDALAAQPGANLFSLFRGIRLLNDEIAWALPYGDDLARAWLECPRGHWMIQMAEAQGVSEKLMVLAAADCVREALAGFKPNREGDEALRYVQFVSDHAQAALRMAEAWALAGEPLNAELSTVHEGHSHRGMASAASHLVAAVAQWAHPERREEGPSLCVQAVQDAELELRWSGVANADAAARIASRVRARIPLATLLKE